MRLPVFIAEVYNLLFAVGKKMPNLLTETGVFVNQFIAENKHINMLPE